MSFIDNVHMAFESLFANRTRSILALLGIVIGVFAVTAMVSLGQMLKESISSDLQSVARRAIIIQPNYDTGFNLKRFTDDDLQLLSQLPIVANPQVMVSVEYEKANGIRTAVQITGTNGDLPDIDPGTRIKQGRYFTQSEANGGLAVAVLNPAAVRELLGKRDPIGKTIRLYYPGGDRVDLLVVGVLEPLPTMFGGEQMQICTPSQFLWRSHPDAQHGKYNFALLRVQDGYRMDRVLKQATQLLDTRYAKGMFRVDSVESMQTMLNSITMGVQVFLGIIGGLSLVVGGIGIMNIMLVSVTERTREIGLRKALGATSRQIRLQFLIEAMVLTLLGGIVGVLLAASILVLVVATVPFLKVFVLTPTTIILALGVSLFIGLFFGVWPAARAAKLDPIESLRYE